MTVSRRTTLKYSLAALAGLPLLASARKAEAATHTVDIQGFAFNPAGLDIDAGDTVTFTNRDRAPHTATAANGAFDTGVIRPGQSAQVTFANSGEFQYSCTIHPNMRAVIVV